MITSYFEHWPKRLTHSLTIPRTTLYHNLLVSASRYPDKTAIYYYGNSISYSHLLREVDALAGFLQKNLGVAKGERILLYMQNSPQFVIAYYAILRANAVVVPVNPMNQAEELSFYLKDCDIRVAFSGQELLSNVNPLIDTTPLKHTIAATYSDYASAEYPHELPNEVKAPRQTFDNESIIPWSQYLIENVNPETETVTADDMAVLPYTSGTTGIPKGCMHTHATVQANVVGTVFWSNVTSDSVSLASLPFFHVTGMEHSMNAPIFIGGTIVVMTRWNRNTAAELIQSQRCTHWVNIATMLIDFLSNPNLDAYQLDSLSSVGGGGAPLPEAIGERLFQKMGVRYAEGYGLSETISQSHVNPPDRSKLQCLGVPSFGVDARILNPETLEELGPHEEGELVINGPQVFKGYWNRPEETQKSFLTIEGKPFFRTGDIAKYDDEGYFFMVDRLKRMINASGYKVWPAEVESVLYKHPAVLQACVIGVPDEHRGETVKAYLVLQQHARGSVTEHEVIEWCKTQMAAYKYPRIIQFVESLPISGSGKILWRTLQEEERKSAANK